MIKYNRIVQYDLPFIILCNIFFTILCIYFIINRCLWTDEINTIITVRRPFIDGLLQLQDYSAPLYQLILRLLVFSDNPPEWLIRIPSVIFGILGILASWFFTRRLFGRKVATLTMVLITINPVYIYYSTEARPYSLFILMTVLSMWTFYNLLITNSIKNMIIYIITTSLLLYSHYLGLFTILGQATYTISVFLLQEKNLRNFARVFYAFGLVLVISSPSLFLLSRYIFSGAPGAVGWILKPSITTFISMTSLFGSKIISVFFIVALITEIWGRPFIFNGEYFWFEKPKKDISISDWWGLRCNTLFCLCWIIYSFFIVLIKFNVTRYTVPAIVPISIIISLSINRIKSKKILSAVILFLLLMMTSNINNVQKLTEAKYYELINFLRDNNNAQTQIFVADWAYCDNFINPELYGLRYYGLNEINIKLLKINFPYNVSIAHPEQLSADKHLYIVNFHLIIRHFLDNFLRSQPRPFRKIDFGSITVFEIERQGYTADWSSSKELP